MAVTFDAQAFKDWTGTGGTFALTPVGSPKGVAVMIAQDPLTTDQITSVTYGGVPLTRLPTNGFATCGGAEPGAAYIYFRGSAVPTSGTVNIVSAAGTFTGWAVTVAGSVASTGIAANGTVHSDAQQNPSVTLPTVAADSGVAVGVLFSGAAAPANATPQYTALTGSTTGGRDFGAQSAVAEQGAVSGANVTVGWTNSSNAVALCAAVIKEVPGLPDIGMAPYLPGGRR